MPLARSVARLRYSPHTHPESFLHWLNNTFTENTLSKSSNLDTLSSLAKMPPKNVGFQVKVETVDEYKEVLKFKGLAGKYAV